MADCSRACNCNIIINIMDDLQKVMKIFRDYEADCRDGFVSNTESWVEQRCIDEDILYLKDDITKLILKAILE